MDTLIDRNLVIEKSKLIEVREFYLYKNLYLLFDEFIDENRKGISSFIEDNLIKSFNDGRKTSVISFTKFKPFMDKISSIENAYIKKKFSTMFYSYLEHEIRKSGFYLYSGPRFFLLKSFKSPILWKEDYSMIVSNERSHLVRSKVVYNLANLLYFACIGTLSYIMVLFCFNLYFDLVL